MPGSVSAAWLRDERSCAKQHPSVVRGEWRWRLRRVRLMCTCLSAVLLVGLVLNATLGWSWADPIAALVIAAIAVREGRDAWQGKGRCSGAVCRRGDGRVRMPPRLRLLPMKTPAAATEPQAPARTGPRSGTARPDGAGAHDRQVREPGDMDIEILLVPGCPNETLAAERLRCALDTSGLSSIGFTTRIVTGQAEAERIGFTGSPTILIDGRDPFAEPAHTPGLSCRMYRTAYGLAGAPDAGQLHEALRAAAAITTAGLTLTTVEKFAFPDTKLPSPAATHILGTAKRAHTGDST